MKTKFLPKNTLISVLRKTLTMTNYTGLWTREASAKLLVSSILLKYGNYLKWNSCNETILHNGCVDGTLTKDILLPYVNDHVEEILGFDKWKYLIDLATEINKNDKIKYQSYNVMTQNVTEMESRFDHIFSFFVAQNSVSNKLLLSRYHTMLKRSGQIVIVTLVDTPIMNSIYIQAKQKKWSRRLGNKNFFENYTSNPLEYFQNLLGETGFKAELCKVVEVPVVIEDFPDMLKWIWVLYGSFWKCIPNNLKEDFLRENTQICVETMTLLCKPNKYGMTIEMLICIASKA